MNDKVAEIRNKFLRWQDTFPHTGMRYMVEISDMTFLLSELEKKESNNNMLSRGLSAMDHIHTELDERIAELKNQLQSAQQRIKELSHFLKTDEATIEKYQQEIEGFKRQIHVYKVADEHYREQVKPIRQYWPFENNPGIGQIVESFQKLIEGLREIRQIASRGRPNYRMEQIHDTASHILDELGVME